MSTEVATAERINPIAEVRVQLDNMTGQFQAALPAHIPVERFARVVMTAIQNNPQILQAPRRELWNAAMKSAQDGLLPDGREGALVCRPGRNGITVTWQPMIAGIRKKARNSGEIATWDAHVVYEHDHFQFQLGDAPQINHSYDLKVERGEPVGAYSVAVMKDGSKSYEVMSVSDINKIRDRSDAWKAFKAGKIKSTPWSTDWSEMARKTVARRHAKVLPMSTDLDDLIRRDDELYQFDEAKEQAKATGRSTLADKLDRLALSGPTEPAEPAEDAGETDQREEVMQNGPTGGQPSPDRGDVATPRPDADAPDGAAYTEPAWVEVVTAAEYIDAAETHILAATDADELEAWWRAGRQIRTRLGVTVDDAKALAEKLSARCAGLRGAK